MDKHTLRTEYQQQRRRISPAERQAVSQTLVTHWQNGPFSQPKLRIGSYLATDHECPTHDLHQCCWQHQHSVFVPVLSQARLGLVEYHADSQLQASGKPGILEPQDGDMIDLNELDVLLLPLLAIDAQGYRLGFGSGYYDRLLAQQRPTYVIGLGYAAQYCQQLPHDPWDVPLDGFLSERGWLFFAQAQRPV